MPHFDIGSNTMNSERSFSSGNERTRMDLHETGMENVGYHVTSQDKFAMIVDLMNMNMVDTTVYLTMTYDYVDSQPAGWSDVKPVWFDANQCGTSEVEAPQESGTFYVASKPWKPNFSGEILGMAGHLHDGGSSVEVMVNNQPICNSEAIYGEKPEYVYTMGNMNMDMKGAMKAAKNHISTMTLCYGGAQTKIPIKTISPDQTWVIRGHYDYGKFAGNLNDEGKQEDIMAIAIMYVKVPKGGVKLTTASRESWGLGPAVKGTVGALAPDTPSAAPAAGGAGGMEGMDMGGAAAPAAPPAAAGAGGMEGMDMGGAAAPATPPAAGGMEGMDMGGAAAPAAPPAAGGMEGMDMGGAAAPAPAPAGAGAPIDESEPHGHDESGTSIPLTPAPAAPAAGGMAGMEGMDMGAGTVAAPVVAPADAAEGC